MTESQGEQVFSSPQARQAWITSLRILAASPKSSNELERKLADKGYSVEVIQDTLALLVSKGLLNDQAYAQSIVSRFVTSQPSGAKRIGFELKRRRVSADIREQVLASLSESSELERAREAGLSRWERFRHLPVEKRKKRTYDFLVRRGFDFQIARDLIEEFEETPPV